VFERFTGSARQVVVLAQDEARTLHHDYIGVEHLLLGLLREREGLAVRVLGSFGMTVEAARAKVASVIGEGDAVNTGQLPFSPRAKRVLERSLREAIALGHVYIGTKHILLALVRETDGLAAGILLDFELDAESIRREVLRRIEAPGYRKKTEADVPWTARRNAVVRRDVVVHGIDGATLTQTVGELTASLDKGGAQWAELEAAIAAAVSALPVGQLIDAIRCEKETESQNGTTERAEALGDIERNLVSLITASGPDKPD
jgi:ATP-dependent Clp protease ATP-binding subunit ClpA